MRALMMNVGKTRTFGIEVACVCVCERERECVVSKKNIHENKLNKLLNLLIRLSLSLSLSLFIFLSYSLPLFLSLSPEKIKLFLNHLSKEERN